MTSISDLSIEQLRAHVVSVFRRGGGSRPEVSLIKVGNTHAVLKDYSRSDPRFRRFVGPVSTRREAVALRRLEGVRGIPRFLARPARDALLMEYVPGKSVRDLKRDALAAEFFERFHDVLTQIHCRGVAHCDLRSKGNIIVGPDGQPWLVDFVAHFKRGAWWNPLTRWMFAKFCEADRTAVARMKRKFLRASLTEAERIAIRSDGKAPLARVARFIGQSIRNISRRLLTRRRG